MDKNIATFLRTNARTIKVKFLDGGGKEYTYVALDSMDLKVDDYVVVPTHVEEATQMNVARVSAIESTVNIRPKDQVKYKYVVCKIDLTAYQQLLEDNKQLEDAYAEAYRRNMQRGYAQTILESLAPEDRDHLQNLLGVVSNGTKTLGN